MVEEDMLVSDLLSPEQIKLELTSTTRLEAIYEVALLLEHHPCVVELQSFYQAVVARERLQSTYVGEGVAFPHARTDFVKDMVIAVGRSSQGIYFGDAERKVSLIFLLGTPKRLTSHYLALVGGLARLVKDTTVRTQLIQAPTAERFIAVLEEAEKRI
ncbi:PTS sugar transporter subunit IIA [Candidatus Methylacidithermus pantelleriae]|uniref:PTS glucose transporter subunit IIA n=1 Tax=Candidatus Methylacidithermus pantelleriae TaxID=2744239 RepID=A0A8J2BUS7_9BACT|nr:PTS sugar transporter subunit IIA [Candidatus Methylacidithermus pantelleriae]CAF0700709.1 PTS glucose transporter subunit IIA [Candidatus Methylacidithermus pantelleriae]